jgi:hypothetical protein
MKEEAIDCLIMAMDIVTRLKMTDHEIDSYLDWKLNKWLDNFAKRKQNKRR